MLRKLPSRKPNGKLTSSFRDSFLLRKKSSQLHENILRLRAFFCSFVRDSFGIRSGRTPSFISIISVALKTEPSLIMTKQFSSQKEVFQLSTLIFQKNCQLPTVNYQLSIIIGFLPHTLSEPSGLLVRTFRLASTYL